jgi:hypothetical protein
VKTLAATFLASMLVQTIAAIDPYGPAPVYLPQPSRYVATWLLWFLMGIGAALSDTLARIVRAMSIVILLTQMVAGGFAKKAIAFFKLVSTNFPATAGAPA